MKRDSNIFYRLWLADIVNLTTGEVGLGMIEL